MTGYLRDPSDRRDIEFSWGERYGSVGHIEPSVDLWFPGMEVRDQGFTNSCTGYAGATAMQMALYHSEGVDPGVLSGVFLYYNGRAVWGGQGRDDGSYMRTLFKSIQLQGACQEKVFTANAGVDKQPTWRAVKNGFKHKGLGSYRMVRNVDEAKIALSRGIPLAGGWGIGPAFSNWRGGDAYHTESTTTSGHAMAVSGYNEDGEFLLVNSYGTDSGEGGFVRVTPEFLISSDRLWACDPVE